MEKSIHRTSILRYVFARLDSSLYALDAPRFLTSRAGELPKLPQGNPRNRMDVEAFQARRTCHLRNWDVVVRAADLPRRRRELQVEKAQRASILCLAATCHFARKLLILLGVPVQ